MTDRRYAVTITCRRPANRAVDDWHVQPERIASTTAIFFGKSVEMTITPRRVRLCAPGLQRLPDIPCWKRRMAEVMNCLYLDVRRVGGDIGGHYELPAPVRVEISVTETASSRAEGQS